MTDVSPADNTDQATDTGERALTERLGLVSTHGTNCGITEMAPGGKAPMHRTHSIDYNILISGQITHILEDGSEQTITEPGSIVVQRGTLHAWENRSKTEWARWVSVLVDAKPAQVIDASGESVTLKEEFQ